MVEGLHAIVGSEGILPVEPLYCLDAQCPQTVVAPQSEQEVASLIAYAGGARFPFVVAGGATALTVLTPHATPWWLLSTRRLRGIVDYSPDDLVLTVRAGTTLQEVQHLLRTHGQYLPWNIAPSDEATIGGIVASNRSGSWRYRHGTPRDRLLQVRAVRGDGVAFRSGAKVVKSVAGYDIHRLLCGSWGTLAVLTEITLKVAPLPPVFEAVGWFCEWDQLEPTLAELMRAPLQPDGLSVLVIPHERFEETYAVSAQARAVRERLPCEQAHHKVSSNAFAPPAGVVELPPPIVYEATKEAHPETETESAVETSRAPSRPLIVLEFSGRPSGVRWQIEWLRSQGYPLQPIDSTFLEYQTFLLCPRQHRFMLQLLMRPNEVAEVMMRWAHPDISMLAHAGSGVVYLWGEHAEPVAFLQERLRHCAFRWRVWSWPSEARSHLPPLPLSAGERRLMESLKRALDPEGLLPTIG